MVNIDIDYFENHYTLTCCLLTVSVISNIILSISLLYSKKNSKFTMNINNIKKALFFFIKNLPFFVLLFVLILVFKWALYNISIPIFNYLSILFTATTSIIPIKLLTYIYLEYKYKKDITYKFIDYMKISYYDIFSILLFITCLYLVKVYVFIPLFYIIGDSCKSFIGLTVIKCQSYDFDPFTGESYPELTNIRNPRSKLWGPYYNYGFTYINNYFSESSFQDLKNRFLTSYNMTENYDRLNQLELRLRPWLPSPGSWDSFESDTDTDSIYSQDSYGSDIIHVYTNTITYKNYTLITNIHKYYVNNILELAVWNPDKREFITDNNTKVLVDLRNEVIADKNEISNQFSREDIYFYSRNLIKSLNWNIPYQQRYNKAWFNNYQTLLELNPPSPFGEELRSYGRHIAKNYFKGRGYEFKSLNDDHHGIYIGENYTLPEVKKIHIIIQKNDFLPWYNKFESIKNCLLEKHSDLNCFVVLQRDEKLSFFMYIRDFHCYNNFENKGVNFNGFLGLCVNYKGIQIVPQCNSHIPQMVLYDINTPYGKFAIHCIFKYLGIISSPPGIWSGTRDIVGSTPNMNDLSIGNILMPELQYSENIWNHNHKIGENGNTVLHVHYNGQFYVYELKTNTSEVKKGWNSTKELSLELHNPLDKDARSAGMKWDKVYTNAKLVIDSPSELQHMPHRTSKFFLPSEPSKVLSKLNELNIEKSKVNFSISCNKTVGTLGMRTDCKN